MKPTRDDLNRLDGEHVDVLIVGGGINGAVTAASLTHRGVSVALVERGDFGSFTSQESSNLVWGGFKYLENYEVPLVRKLSRSRNRLLKAYPSVISELRFLATLDASSPFPSWLAALGTVGYWGLGTFATRPPRYLRPNAINKVEPVVNAETAGAAVEYSDAYLKDNDSRFVWSFISSAVNAGALASNYVELTGAKHGPSGWTATIEDRAVTGTGQTASITASAIVNATGPFANGLDSILGVKSQHRVVYSKGIHLVVPELTPNERVLAFFDDSQRLFFVIPMANRSVIGTTDTRTDDPFEPPNDQDRQFLLEQINARLNLDQPLTMDDVLAERSGVRPLVVDAGSTDHDEVDWTSLSRKHSIDVDTDRSVITIFGGKLTDCLNVGDELADAVENLEIKVGQPPKKSASHMGGWFGEPPADKRAEFLESAFTLGLDRPPEVEREESVAMVLWRRHGLDAHHALDAIRADPSQSRPILAGCDILRAELGLFAEREKIVTLCDFVRRRTKLAMMHRIDDLLADPGMAEVCTTLGVTPSSID